MISSNEEYKDLDIRQEKYNFQNLKLWRIRITPIRDGNSMVS